MNFMSILKIAIEWVLIEICNITYTHEKKLFLENIYGQQYKNII